MRYIKTYEDAIDEFEYEISKVIFELFFEFYKKISSVEFMHVETDSGWFILIHDRQTIIYVFKLYSRDKRIILFPGINAEVFSDVNNFISEILKPYTKMNNLIKGNVIDIFLKSMNQSLIEHIKSELTLEKFEIFKEATRYNL